jgi:hypothetical protein
MYMLMNKVECLHITARSFVVEPLKRQAAHPNGCVETKFSKIDATKT